MIKRPLLHKIRDHLTSSEITIIVGPRQAGKTYLMEELEQELAKKGERTLFLNLDLDRDRPLATSQETLLHNIRIEIGKEKGYVFIDEIQRKENAGLFLKGLYDMKLPYKFIVSGSGSLELKEKIKESLPGRKRLFELLTVSFEEFVDFKLDYKYSNRLAEYLKLRPQNATQMLKEYLNFGGYPKVVISQTLEEKTAAINDIYQSYLERDIAGLLHVQKTDSFTNLVRVLASQAGNLVNIAELSSTLGISMPTVKEYLWYIEKTYIAQKVTPFYRNIRKEISKAGRYYFIDLGLKNYSMNQFGTVAIISPPSGFTFENFVFRMLKDRLYSTPTTMHFWRTQDKAEVDFVLQSGMEVIPIEVKYKRMEKVEITRSYRSFLARYKPKNGYIVHLGEEREIQVDDTLIHLIPFYRLVEKNLIP